MLTEHDIEFIKNNRSEITANRTETITLVHVTKGESDPYTGESTETESREIVEAVWKEYSTVTNGDLTVIGGVELRQDDVKVTFDSSVVLSDVKVIERDGADFTIVAIDEKGIGVTNRLECVVRRVT